MRRREFITLLGGAAAAWPLAVSAQQAERVYKIGYLQIASREQQLHLLKAFEDGLQSSVTALVTTSSSSLGLRTAS